MRGEHEVLRADASRFRAGHAVAVFLRIADLAHQRVFEDARAELHGCFGDGEQVAANVKDVLIAIVQAAVRGKRQRHLLDPFRLDARSRKKLLLPLQVLAMLLFFGVEKSVDGFEATIDLQLVDERSDQSDGGANGLGVQACGLFTMVFDQILIVGVGGLHDVRGGVTGLRHRDPPSLDDNDGLAGLRQEIRRRDAGDAAADDGHIRGDFTLQRRIVRGRRRVDPQRE